MPMFINYEPATGAIVSYQEAPTEAEADPVPAGLERVIRAEPVKLDGVIAKDGQLYKNGLQL